MRTGRTAAGRMSTRGMGTRGMGAAAFSVLGRFQIANFSSFLVSHINCPAAVGYWFVLCQWLRTTIDARRRHLLLGSDHQVASVFLFCAWAFDVPLRRSDSSCCSTCSLSIPY